MTSQEFEQELKAIDPCFSVIDNPNRPGLSNIFFDGQNYDLPVIPTNDLRDEIDASYQYEFPNGMRARFWSKPEVLGRIHDFLSKIKSPEYKKQFDEE